MGHHDLSVVRDFFELVFRFPGCLVLGVLGAWVLGLRVESSV